MIGPEAGILLALGRYSYLNLIGTLKVNSFKSKFCGAGGKSICFSRAIIAALKVLFAVDCVIAIWRFFPDFVSVISSVVLAFCLIFDKFLNTVFRISWPHVATIFWRSLLVRVAADGR